MIWVHAAEVGLGDVVEHAGVRGRVVCVSRPAGARDLTLTLSADASRSVVTVALGAWVRLDRAPERGPVTLWSAHPTSEGATRTPADLMVVSDAARLLYVDDAQGRDFARPLVKFTLQADGFHRELGTRTPRWLTMGYRPVLFG